MPFEGYQWGYERDLKLDPFVTQRGSNGQGRDLVEGARELLCGFNQRRALQRPLSCLAPQARRLLDQAGLGAMPCEQMRVALGDVGKLPFDCVCDTSVQRASRLAQQGAKAASCTRACLNK
jgi:hypothetical protein